MKFLTSLFVCAVNVYVLISGYFLSASNRRNIIKILEQLFQLILLSIIIYFVNSSGYSFVGFINSLIPCNWFVVLYIVLYLISPFLNLVIKELNKKQYVLLLVLLFCLFSFYPTLIDLIEAFRGYLSLGTSTIGMFGSQSGYTIVNFVLIYFIGGFIRKFGLENLKKIYLVPLFFVCSFIILGWSYLEPNSAWAYCNPFVIAEAVLAFLIFRSIKMPNIKPIIYLSQASFMVYLTHIYFLKFIPVSWFANFNIFAIIFYEFAFAMILYFIGFVINLIYSLTFKLIFDRLSKIKIFKVDYFKWWCYNNTYETYILCNTRKYRT